jgi:ATP-dependent Clp protease, protease subunit
VAKRLQRDDIDKCMDHGIDLSSRTVFLMEDIEEYSVEPAIKALHILDRSPGEIVIKMTTNGGDWYAGMALYDAIAACENPVKFIGMGKVLSMGGIIMQSADERLLTKHCAVLVHYGSDWAGGHVKDLERRALENKRTGVEMEDVFLPRIREKIPGFSREDFKQKFAFDVYMSAKEAVDFGLADDILA